VAKTPKKAKTPKAPKGRGGNGSGRDTVTGLTVNLEGIGRIESDKVYDKDSAIAKEWFSYYAYRLPDIVESFIEFEFSEKYIIGTTLSKYANGDSQVIRTVMQGVFKYKNQEITSAAVAFTAEDNIAPGSLYGITTPYLSGEVRGKGGGSRSIANPSSLLSWVDTLSGFNDVLLDYTRGAVGDGPESAGDESAVRAFAGGQFFQAGWWQDPFTPNLI